MEIVCFFVANDCREIAPDNTPIVLKVVFYPFRQIAEKMEKKPDILRMWH
jgi:hypothetical protein